MFVWITWSKSEGWMSAGTSAGAACWNICTYSCHVATWPSDNMFLGSQVSEYPKEIKWMSKVFFMMYPYKSHSMPSLLTKFHPDSRGRNIKPIACWEKCLFSMLRKACEMKYLVEDSLKNAISHSLPSGQNNSLLSHMQNIVEFFPKNSKAHALTIAVWSLWLFHLGRLQV